MFLSFFFFLRRVYTPFADEVFAFVQSCFDVSHKENSIKIEANKIMGSQWILYLYPYSHYNTPQAFPENSAAKTLHIFEDLWHQKKSIYKNKIKSIFGSNQTIAGRACTIIKLDKNTADIFFNENHLHGSTTAGYKYGLLYKNELVAAISFSKARTMTDGQIYYRSYELIRFSNKLGTTVTGGLNKLLKHFIKEKNVQHLMTYIDLNWGNGKAFIDFGFKENGQVLEIESYVDPGTHLRSKENNLASNQALLKVPQLGSKKLLLDLRTY